MRAVRFAISISQVCADGEFDPVAFRNDCTAVEQLGYEGAWARTSRC